MKKNLISVLILALVLVNVVLNAILLVTILPATKQANQLITTVASAIDLELQSGETTNASSIPIADLSIYTIADTLTVNLKTSADGQEHYGVVSVTLSLNTKDEDYETYGTNMDTYVEWIKSDVNSVISSHTYEEVKADQQKILDEILEALQERFDSDFIVEVNFSSATFQ